MNLTYPSSITDISLETFAIVSKFVGYDTETGGNMPVAAFEAKR
ncbi:MAG TPA: hypothetical protein VFK32_04535 [Tepidiformaceae bacterium]|nr:hypothetical protein [Tepidiformaceae bacterium]